MNSKPKALYSMVITAVLLGIGLILPFITGQIQVIAQIISPLHIPVLICGLTCGWKWGLVLGIVLPLLRSVLFQLPPFPNAALPMAFELAVYGCLTGILYPAFVRFLRRSNRLPSMIAALIIAMIAGRIAGGAAKGILIAAGIVGSADAFTFSVFFTSYFVTTAPGALIHIIVIPIIVTAVEKAGLSPMFSRR